MNPGHYIAIFGGAVAGAEAASSLAEKGIRCVVFDQNSLPYGKLESGLPKWHYKLRNRQEQLIDEKLQHPLIRFVPNTRLGRDLDFHEVTQKWGFSAVLLAVGAWADRPLPIPGMESFAGSSLWYQNPFVQWFNKKHDPAYDGKALEIPDKTIIIGGGLASLDVAKIALMEFVFGRLNKQGHKIGLLELEHRGIPAVLEDLGLSLAEIGYKGCCLYTRHAVAEMPLTPLPDNPTARDLEKAAKSRQTILGRVQQKFPFEVVGRKIGKEAIVKNGQLRGMVFLDTAFEDGRYQAIPGTEQEVDADLIISAIGSIPEPIPGVPMKGEIFDVEDTATGKIRGFDNVFALGNAVTGRGNIRQSQLHGRQVTETIIDQYLAWDEKDYQEIFEAAENRVDNRVESIISSIEGQPPLTTGQLQDIDLRVAEYARKAGYSDNYSDWISRHLPPRIEEMEASH